MINGSLFLNSLTITFPTARENPPNNPTKQGNILSRNPGFIIKMVPINAMKKIKICRKSIFPPKNFTDRAITYNGVNCAIPKASANIIFYKYNKLLPSQ